MIKMENQMRQINDVEVVAEVVVDEADEVVMVNRVMWMAMVNLIVKIAM